MFDKNLKRNLEENSDMMANPTPGNPTLRWKRQEDLQLKTSLIYLSRPYLEINCKETCLLGSYAK